MRVQLLSPTELLFSASQLDIAVIVSLLLSLSFRFRQCIQEAAICFLQPQVSSALYFKHNTALGLPYRVLIDTNFINFSIQNKLDLETGMMNCLYAKYCAMAELEKLDQKY
ncbi:rRNA-processing FCF1 homolog [Olea europaea subsp. europaea]|uniref:rRNA-processing FCF1 homolog n=1 Tax=Olea europaea subsp. europaea TaxID=158383 RepID=A0A8S0S6D9_OLEEU|nr:rRNA-processing FCF1 homolog [Olea europaea subsp. europaea]